MRNTKDIRVLTTFVIGSRAELSFLSTAQDVYSYTAELIKSLTSDKSFNPVVDSFKVFAAWYFPKMLRGEKVDFVRSENIGDLVLRGVDHHFKLWSTRSMKVSITDIFVEERDLVKVPIFSGELLDFNKAIQQYYKLEKK